ncbi:MAG: single-stranded DNA-binding protein [Clostridia bacterium]|nr:single-stranded DNA-binding protein [Clostridia bacterium]
MNKIFLIGNLTGDPELRTTPNGVNVCTMNIAVNRRFAANRDDRQTDFFRITAWRQLGETCSRFLSKGKKIAVVGELSARTYEAKDGTTRVSLEVTADEVEFLSPRDGAPAGQGYPQNQGYQGQGGYQPQQGYNRAYPHPSDNNPAQDAPRQNSWQDNRASDQGAYQGTSLGNSSDGFTDVTDDDLPF